MSVSPADPTSRVVLLLIQLSVAVHDAFGVTPVKVAFKTLEEGRSFSLPVPPLLAPSVLARAAVLEDDPPLSITSTERRILKAIEVMHGDSPTGEAVALAAKLPYESNFRKLLHAMRLKGVLGGEKGATGYPITTLGLEIIEPENGAI